LIFVHPKGAVVEKSGVWTFHPVGKQLQEGRVLNEQEQPEVFNALKKLEAGAAGISRRPE